MAATINYCFMLAGLLGQYLHTCHECCCSWQISRCMLNEECQTGLVGIQMSGMLNEKCLKWSPWRKVTMHISTHPAQVFLRHIFLHFLLNQNMFSSQYSLPLFLSPFLVSFPPLLSASSNDSHAPPPPCVICFHPFSSHLSVPLSLTCPHSLTFSTRLQTHCR